MFSDSLTYGDAQGKISGMSALEVLGQILARAREALGRSPEKVAGPSGVAGRTIRRLENAGSDRPRRVTLDALAHFYGLDAGFLSMLASWSELSDERLNARLVASAQRVLGEEEAALYTDEPSVELAMRVARRGARPVFPAAGDGRTQSAVTFLAGDEASARERAEAVDMVLDYVAMDARRRRLARELMRELRRSSVAPGWVDEFALPLTEG